MDSKNNELYALVERLLWVMRKYQQRNVFARGPLSDPRRGQGRVLALLKFQPEMSQKDLSYLLGIRQQSLGELLAKLEKNGYITREHSETDKRALMIKLTEKGAAETQETPSDMGDLFDCLSDEEKDTLKGYIERILSSLEERFDDAEPAFVDWVQTAKEYGSENLEKLAAIWREGGMRFGAHFGAHFGGRGSGRGAHEHGNDCDCEYCKRSGNGAHEHGGRGGHGGHGGGHRGRGYGRGYGFVMSETEDDPESVDDEQEPTAQTDPPENETDSQTDE